MISHQITSVDRKRKASDSIEYKHRVIVPPKFCSARMLDVDRSLPRLAAKASTVLPPKFISAQTLKSEQSLHVDRNVPTHSTFHCPVHNDRATTPSFMSLPHEIFCSIVGYLGPTSATLCSLAQLTPSHRILMNTIGDVMLPVAKSRFRIPLPRKGESESTISQFVRHACVSKEVHDNLLVLRRTLQKDFLDLESMKDNTLSASPGVVTSDELDQSLDVALCLLGAGQSHSYLLSGSFLEKPDLAVRIANSAATTALERMVSRLCAELGAKAYKYAKLMLMMCDPSEEQIISPIQVTDEYEVEDDFSEGTSQTKDDDVNRLDKACLVMQLTIAKDFKTSRQVRLAACTSVYASK